MIENQLILKDRVESLLESALFCIDNDESFLHSTVIADCVKSLIGTDLNDPCESLLEWLSSDLEKREKKENLESNQAPEIQTTSYKELQEALVRQDRQLVENILTRLNFLTDGTQLIEVLIEMSLYQTGRSFVPIWRIYKILNFINLKDRLRAYKLMCGFIFEDSFRKNCFNNEKVLNKTILHISDNYLDIVVFSHILDCQSHLFIRQEKLSYALNSMIEYIGMSKNKGIFETHGSSSKKDRVSVLNKIRKNKLKLSKKNILILDSIRMLIKNKPTINDAIVEFMYDNLNSN